MCPGSISLPFMVMSWLKSKTLVLYQQQYSVSRTAVDSHTSENTIRCIFVISYEEYSLAVTLDKYCEYLKNSLVDLQSPSNDIYNHHFLFIICHKDYSLIFTLDKYFECLKNIIFAFGLLFLIKIIL